MSKRTVVPCERNRVVITGLGALTPLGLTAEDTWEGLLAGRSGIDEFLMPELEDSPCQIAGELKGFRAQDYIDRKDAKRLARFSQIAIIAAGMALEDSGLELSDEQKEDVGVVQGTAVGGTVIEVEGGLKRLGPRSLTRISPNHLLALPPNMAAFHIAKTFGFHGYCNTTVTACAAGAQAIGDAAELIRHGRAEVMIAGGSEATLTPVAFASFAVMRALSTQNGNPAASSRPFDAKRDGFVMAEGSAIFVLESLEHALARDARIYAEVVGYAANTDGFHVIAPNPDPTGPIKAIRHSLADAGMSPDEVDHVNSHGTGTPLGDVAETKAIKAVFGDRAYEVPITANKSMLGHGLGSAGAMESLSCVLSIRDQKIPPTINLENPDPECDLDYVPNVAREAKIDVVLKNSFGMGNQNACLVFERYSE